MLIDINGVFGSRVLNVWDGIMMMLRIDEALGERAGASGPYREAAAEVAIALLCQRQRNIHNIIQVVRRWMGRHSSLDTETLTNHIVPFLVLIFGENLDVLPDKELIGLTRGEPNWTQEEDDERQLHLARWLFAKALLRDMK